MKATSPAKDASKPSPSKLGSAPVSPTASKSPTPPQSPSPSKSPSKPATPSEAVQTIKPEKLTQKSKKQKESPLRFENAKKELALRIANTISGQFAILFKDKESDLIAIPINLYNKSGKVVLGIERSPIDVVWGAKLGKWTSVTNIIGGPEFPPGLAVLTNFNKLFISHTVSSKAELSDHTMGRVILVRNELGDIVMAGKERTNSRPRYVYGKTRQIDLKLYDPFKREIVFCRQYMRFSSNVFCFYLQRMDVMAQPGKAIGRIRQQCALCGTSFNVETNSGQVAFRIKPIDWSRQTFNIYNQNNAIVGHIKPSLRDEVSAAKELPIANIEWTEKLDPIQKTLLLSATFLIKFLFYDR